MSGYKTIVFAVLLALLSVFSNAEMQAFVGENWPAVGTSIAAIVAVLRALTTSTIFKP